MLLTSKELQAKFNLGEGYIVCALTHEKCPAYYDKNAMLSFAKYEEADAVEALRSYYKYQERLAMENLNMWKGRAERFEATLIELG